MKYIKSQKISLKNHPELNEQWLQEKIAEEPEILGLGKNIEVVRKEKKQPSGGRLDLLLSDDNANSRFTVEIQLGECNPDHIIRTIEYWDVERKRFPQYKHTAVIIAEDITSRFWNIINLFNRNIPLIAIQLEARTIEEGLMLNFIKVLDEVEYGLEEEDESEPTDRAYWDKKSTPKQLENVDELKKLLDKFVPDLKLNYNKHYIGLYRGNRVDNFIIFQPCKAWLDIGIKKNTLTDETLNDLESHGHIEGNIVGQRRIKIRLFNKDGLEEKLPMLEKVFKEVIGFKDHALSVA